MQKKIHLDWETYGLLYLLFKSSILVVKYVSEKSKVKQ